MEHVLTVVLPQVPPNPPEYVLCCLLHRPTLSLLLLSLQLGLYQVVR